MKASAPILYYPNRMGRIVLLATEEVIGRTGMNTVLDLASLSKFIHNYPPCNKDLQIPFETISRLQGALEEAYGPRGGCGMALRIGRACFKYGLREYGPDLGFTNPDFRLLPLAVKLKVGSEAFLALLNNYSHPRVCHDSDEQKTYWHIENCPLCWSRQTDHPACHLAVGLLQEALNWLSGGKYYLVTESHCIARGDETCTIVIDKTPMN